MSEVAALGVLGVRAPGAQRDPHVGQRRAREHAHVVALHRVREDEPLPVPVELVFRAARAKDDAAPPRPGLHEQVGLRVVAQRLEVADAHRGRAERLFVENPRRAEVDRKPVAVGKKPPHDLELHGAHELQVDLLQALAPRDAEHRVLAGELAQGREHGVGVLVAGEHAVGEHGREHRGLRVGLGAQAVAGAHAREPRDRAEPSRADLPHRLEPRADRHAQLVDLLRPGLAGTDDAHDLLGAKRAAGDLEPRDPLAPAPVAHAVHARRELTGPLALLDELRQAVEEPLHAVVLERGAKEDREGAPLRHEPADRPGRERARLKVLVERRVVGHGRRLAREVICRHAALRQPRAELGNDPGALLGGAAIGQKVGLVHKDERGDAAAREQAPQGLGVALDAVASAHHEQGVVERGERALRLGAEVDVARRVDEHEAHAGVLELGLRAEDRDTAGALHRVGVQMRVAAVHPPERADAPGVVEHGLRERGLARVDVGEYADDRLLQALLLAVRQQKTKLGRI